jgi:WbqC-like protein family
MKLGIMQPYFFPYIGHFALIAHTDFWIVFDEPQYTPKTWINRNRVLHPFDGWNWVSIPLANNSINIKIKDAEILNISEAKISALGKLSHYKKKAPFFNEVSELLSDSFNLNHNSKSLVELNVRSLKNVCEYLGIPFGYKICSNLNIPFNGIINPDDWALEICISQGFKEYINPIGGRNLFNPDKYNKRGVNISFLDIESIRYLPKGYSYIENLSILDVMMWVPANEIKNFILNNAKLI